MTIIPKTADKKDTKSNKKSSIKKKSNNSNTIKQQDENNDYIEDVRPKCSICNEGVGGKEMCECDGTIHHRTCHIDAYTCPQCHRYGLINDPETYGCPYCGYPDENFYNDSNNNEQPDQQPYDTDEYE